MGVAPEMVAKLRATDGGGGGGRGVKGGRTKEYRVRVLQPVWWRASTMGTKRDERRYSRTYRNSGWRSERQKRGESKKQTVTILALPCGGSKEEKAR